MNPVKHALYLFNQGLIRCSLLYDMRRDFIKPLIHFLPSSHPLPSVARVLKVPQSLRIMELDFSEQYGNEGEREDEYIHFPFSSHSHFQSHRMG